MRSAISNDILDQNTFLAAIDGPKWALVNAMNGGGGHRRKSQWNKYDSSLHEAHDSYGAMYHGGATECRKVC